MTDEEDALELTHRLIGEHLAQDYVIAQRIRARLTPGQWERKPRKPEEPSGGVYPVRWQRAEIDGAALTVAWCERGESLDGSASTSNPIKW